MVPYIYAENNTRGIIKDIYMVVRYSDLSMAFVPVSHENHSRNPMQEQLWIYSEESRLLRLRASGLWYQAVR
jgi:hypothetical protein